MVCGEKEGRKATPQAGGAFAMGIKRYCRQVVRWREAKGPVTGERGTRNKRSRMQVGGRKEPKRTDRSNTRVRPE